MVYVLIHLAVAIFLLASARNSLTRGYFLDEDDEEVRAGTTSFAVSLVFLYGLAAYCIGVVAWGAFCATLGPT